MTIQNSAITDGWTRSQGYAKALQSQTQIDDILVPRGASLTDYERRCIPCRCVALRAAYPSICLGRAPCDTGASTSILIRLTHAARH
jgi:hypothetical protein